MVNRINLIDFSRLLEDESKNSVIVFRDNLLSLRKYSAYDFLGYNKTDHQLVWQIFFTTLMNHFKDLNYEPLIQSSRIKYEPYIRDGGPLTKPVLRKVVYSFSKVFLENLHSKDEIDPKWLTPLEIHKKVTIAQKIRPLSQSTLSEILFFKMNNFWDFDAQTVFEELKFQVFNELKNKSYYSYLELLTKTIGLIYLKEGEIIPAPGIDGKNDYYVLHKKIAKNGLVAFAFRPVSQFSTHHPLLVFRPTVIFPFSEDSLFTLLNDLEPSLGIMGYSSAKRDLELLMLDNQFLRDHSKIDVAGFSLGGAHSQRFTADFIGKINLLFSVNAPSVEGPLAERFASTINQLSNDDCSADMKIVVLRTKDDLAHHVGDKHLGWGIDHPKCKREFLQIDFVERQTEPTFSVLDSYIRHTNVFLSQDELNYVAERHEEEVFDNLTDNVRHSRAIFLENLRIFLGRYIVFPITYVLNIVFWSMHKYLHISVLRYSEAKFDYMAFFRSQR